MSRRAKIIVWSIAGFGLIVLAVGAVLVIAAMRALDTDRDLDDFASPSEARKFTSAHLPAPLPADAVVEKLSYTRWTDWRLTAQIRLPSPAALEQYLEVAKTQRVTNDEYCSDLEPTGGARYFLREVSACGSIQRASPAVLDVACNTR